MPLGLLLLAGWLNFRQAHAEARRYAQHTVQALSEHAQRTFRALVDIGLPGMSGYELARRLRAGAPGIALVAVTGYGQSEDREKARAAGFDAHLTKPFAYDELIRALARIERRAAA